VRGIRDGDYFTVITINLDKDPFSPPSQTRLVHNVFTNVTTFTKNKQAEHVADPNVTYEGFGNKDSGSTSNGINRSNNKNYEIDATTTSRDSIGDNNVRAGTNGGGTGTDSTEAEDILAQATVGQAETNVKDSCISVKTPTHSDMASYISQTVRKVTNKICDEAFKLKSGKYSFLSSQ
jgi:hypothetical protein